MNLTVKKWFRVLVLCASSGLSACVSSGSGADVVTVIEAADGAPESTLWVQTLVGTLEEPWGLDFLPDGNFLVTEKAGALKAISANDYTVTDVAGVPPSADEGQGGLMDVLVHPDFAHNSLIYLSYTVAENKQYSTRVMRARLVAGALVDQQVLFTAQPYYPQRRHFGSRLLLADGYLFITVGDRGNRDLAQSLHTHNGKVMRLYEDGRVPADNPFVGSETALPEIWTYGHRNPQGIARHPQTGDIWVAEHGPQGGDEINRLVAGANYGWPLATYGEEYGGGKIGQGTHLAGTLQPVAYYVPSIGTAGIDFYTGKTYPGWTDSLLVSGLRLALISRYELAGEGLGRETRLPMSMRVRDLQQGPDGMIYALADGSRLVRLEWRQP